MPMVNFRNKCNILDFCRAPHLVHEISGFCEYSGLSWLSDRMAPKTVKSDKSVVYTAHAYWSPLLQAQALSVQHLQVSQPPCAIRHAVPIAASLGFFLLAAQTAPLVAATTEAVPVAANTLVSVNKAAPSSDRCEPWIETESGLVYACDNVVHTSETTDGVQKQPLAETVSAGGTPQKSTATAATPAQSVSKPALPAVPLPAIQQAEPPEDLQPPASHIETVQSEDVLKTLIASLEADLASYEQQYGPQEKHSDIFPVSGTEKTQAVEDKQEPAVPNLAVEDEIGSYATAGLTAAPEPAGNSGVVQDSATMVFRSSEPPAPREEVSVEPEPSTPKAGAQNDVMVPQPGASTEKNRVTADHVSAPRQQAETGQSLQKNTYSKKVSPENNRSEVAAVNHHPPKKGVQSVPPEEMTYPANQTRSIHPEAITPVATNPSKNLGEPSRMVDEWPRNPASFVVKHSVSFLRFMLGVPRR